MTFDVFTYAISEVPEEALSGTIHFVTNFPRPAAAVKTKRALPAAGILLLLPELLYE